MSQKLGVDRIPIPEPRGDESRDEFISRCMGNDVMLDEFPDEGQRFAVCASQWERGGGNPPGSDKQNQELKFAVGDFVEVINPHEEHHRYGLIVEVHEGVAYGLVFPGETMVHRWYVGFELEEASEEDFHRVLDDMENKDMSVQMAKEGGDDLNGKATGDLGQIEISLKMMEELCPDCAEKMKGYGIQKLVIAPKQMPEQLLEGLCNRYGEVDGFFTRCVEDPPSGIDDPETFCAWLHNECHGVWPAEAASKYNKGEKVYLSEQGRPEAIVVAENNGEIGVVLTSKPDSIRWVTPDTIKARQNMEDDTPSDDADRPEEKAGHADDEDDEEEENNPQLKSGDRVRVRNPEDDEHAEGMVRIVERNMVAVDFPNGDISWFRLDRVQKQVIDDFSPGDLVRVIDPDIPEQETGIVSEVDTEGERVAVTFPDGQIGWYPIGRLELEAPQPSAANRKGPEVVTWSSKAEITGPIVFKNEMEKIAYAAVLVPGEEDADGDHLTGEQVRKAAHEWMEKYRNVDLQHTLNNIAEPVESYLLPQDMDVVAYDNQFTLPAGTWVLAAKIKDDEVWDAVLDGRLTGYSIMGIRRQKFAELAGENVSRKAVEKQLKKTVLEDLGDDWVAPFVSIVDDPAVPKAKFFALKRREQPRDGFIARVVKRLGFFNGDSKQAEREAEDMKREDIIAAVKEAIEGDETITELESRLDMIEKSLADTNESEADEEAEEQAVDASNGDSASKEVNISDDTSEVEIDAEPEEESTVDDVAQIRQEMEAFKSEVAETIERALKGDASTKSLKGQDGLEQERKELDFGGRDSFGRKIQSKKEANS